MAVAFVACFVSQAPAADLADLAKIQIKVTTEAQVRALLGEPKEDKNILKSGARREGPKERKDLIYDFGGKEVIIRIDPKTGLVVKVMEL